MHAIELQHMKDQEAAYEKWAAEHADQLVAEAYSDWVETLCEGHESLRGDAMGAETFCDGTCRPRDERSREAWDDYLEGMFPDD